MYKNVPPGRDIMDHQSITYDYANGVQMSFTQLVFHPRGMPAANQMINVYGTKGAVELMNSAQFYSIDGKEQRLLTPKVEQKNDAHTEAFFSAILTGSKVPADITVGATGALTAILGNMVCEQGRVVNWSEFGIQV
jgi:predicted dehydrogenase